MKTAVEKRENSLISAYTTYTDKVKTARETRKSALLNAWTIENWKERRAAINQAWINYRKSVRSAQPGASLKLTENNARHRLPEKLKHWK
jgi:hypothetical protein